MKLDFEKNNGLIPAIIQDAFTGRVLMLGFMNEEALQKTKKTGLVTFFSRSRQTLWTKGETSGNYLKVVDILVDCDQDTLLIKAHPQGPVCHTGKDTCFAEQNRGSLQFLEYLEEIIEDRKKNPQSDSYTSKLFVKGINKIAQKVGEEATEVVIDAVDGNNERLLEESADLIYHLLVLLKARGFGLRDVVKILEERHSG
ncbi:MAG: bifunctional phosphoribosyl-AMP cyclohydrolase/phosphoribosyl-ATP diphosphatase HisIE [Calditrichaeota bacterium]|nr:bifunctional phosphoribosyl-AMP cyclohydrolase/phosphoribosyl-ATP diphosphatase HisIE [Calditrichota bacterium]